MINLLPPEHKQAIVFAKRNTMLLQYTVLIVAITTAIGAILLYGLMVISSAESSLSSSIEYKKTELAQYQGSLKESRNLSDKISRVSQLLNQEVSFREVIQEIGAVLPENASIGSFSLSEDFTSPLALSINVEGTNRNDAVRVRENISQSEIFGEADISEISIIEDEDTGQGNQVVQINTSFADATKNQSAAEQAKINKRGAQN